MSYSISTKSTESTIGNISLVLANKWCNCFFAKEPKSVLNVKLNEDFYLETNDGNYISGIYYLSESNGKIELNKKMANQKGNDKDGKIFVNDSNTIISSSGNDLLKISFNKSTDKYIIYVEKNQ